MAIEISFVDSISCKELIVSQQAIKTWLRKVIQTEGKALGNIDFILCNDQYLLKINQDFLNHDTFTDIITFPYSYTPIEAEIYISCERVEENARNHTQQPEKEMLRVMVHGVLHMCGYDDHSAEDKIAMRQLEDRYLKLIFDSNS